MAEGVDGPDRCGQPSDEGDLEQEADEGRNRPADREEGGPRKDEAMIRRIFLYFHAIVAHAGQNRRGTMGHPAFRVDSYYKMIAGLRGSRCEGRSFAKKS